MQGDNDTKMQAENPLYTNQCFLCLQNISFESEVFSDIPDDKLRIQYIFKYLGVSSKDLFNSKDKQNHGEFGQFFENKGLKKETTDSICIKLCYTCTVVTAKLSSLIKQLEVTQMWIDYRLQQLHQVLEASENEEITKNSPDLARRELRKRLKTKCKQNLIPPYSS